MDIGQVESHAALSVDSPIKRTFLVAEENVGERKNNESAKKLLL